MSSHAVLTTNLSEHPAARAWAKLRAARTMPSAITPLKTQRKATQKSGVYRLHGVGMDGCNVIAKRCGRATAVLERAVYEEILPRLPIRTLHFYGYVEEASSEYSWLLMEDAGDQKYTRTEDHANLVARWLAKLHTSAAACAGGSLPDRGPAHYLKHLQAARSGILENASSASLSIEDRRLLHGILQLCDRLESSWDRIESICKPMPATLVHGDVKRKNLRVLAGVQDVLVALDWEMAGWGPPAADLGILIYNGANPLGAAALAEYVSTVQPFWRSVDTGDVERMAQLGAVFRLLASIHWASQSLQYEWVAKSMSRMRLYEARLGEMLGSMGLRGNL